MRKPILIVIGLAIFLALVINGLFNEPEFDDILDQIEYAEKSNQPNEVESLYLKLLKKNPNNIDYNYYYIQSHFDIPFKKRKGRNSYEYRNDEIIGE